MTFGDATHLADYANFANHANFADFAIGNFVQRNLN